jgi:hypothetical protein
MATPWSCDCFIQNQNSGITISTTRMRNPTGEVSLIFLLSCRPHHSFCFDLQLPMPCHRCGIKDVTRLRISESYFKGCGGSLFIFGHVGCRILVVLSLSYRFVSSSLLYHFVSSPCPCSMVVVVVWLLLVVVVAAVVGGCSIV